MNKKIVLVSAVVASLLVGGAVAASVSNHRAQADPPSADSPSVQFDPEGIETDYINFVVDLDSFAGIARALDCGELVPTSYPDIVAVTAKDCSSAFGTASLFEFSTEEGYRQFIAYSEAKELPVALRPEKFAVVLPNSNAAEEVQESFD